MTDIPIAIESPQLLHNNNTSTHQHHQISHHKPQQLKQQIQSTAKTTTPPPQSQQQQQPQQQQQQSSPQPFPNLEIKKNGLVYIKSSNNSSNGTKSSTGLSRTTSNSGLNSPLEKKSPAFTSTTASSSVINNITSSANRKRSNSQSQVVSMPGKPKYSGSSTRDHPKSSLSNMSGPLVPPSSNATTTGSLLPKSSSSSHGPSPLNPRKRSQIQYYVTLLPLNDTFIKKHLPVATYPETTKLGRPTGTKHKPDVTNGYFDSRVLSRNHAQIYIDPKNGKLMLQDLGSSNGTYLNDVRLNNDPTEVKMGDIVCLGFNVQAESTHKQISLKIENINVISTQLENGGVGKNGENGNLYGKGLDSPEFRHISFIEDICNEVEKKSKQSPDNKVISKHQLSYENYLFNDVNTELDDYLLGLYSNPNTGIYNNSRIGSPSCVESIISTLLMNLTRVKQQTTVLQELVKDYENFKSFSEEQNKKMESIDKKLKISEEDKSKLNNLLTDLKYKNNAIGRERDLNEQEVKNKLDKISLLEQQVQELEIQKEKYEREKQEREELVKQQKIKEAEEEEKEKEKEKELAEAEAEVKAKERVTITEIDEQVRQQQELNNFIADLSRTPSFKNPKIPPEPNECDVEPFPTVEEYSHSEGVSERGSPSPSPPSSHQIHLSKNHSNTQSKKIVKFALDNAPHVLTVTVAMTAMIIGYFFKQLTT